MISFNLDFIFHLAYPKNEVCVVFFYIRLIYRVSI